MLQKANLDDQVVLGNLLKSFFNYGMQHFSGMHCTMDFRTALPKPFLAYYPALINQDLLNEGVALLHTDGSVAQDVEAGHPPEYTDLQVRENYETTDPIQLSTFGPTKKVPLGDVVLARSGDKGANVNIGLFVRKASHYSWLQSLLTRDRMRELMGQDWRSDYFIERVEFPRILAVHFVIYGPLGRGVSSCRLLDALGKGFADYIRCKIIDVPISFIEDIEQMVQNRPSTLEYSK